VASASQLLETSTAFDDAFANAVQTALQYHVAVVEQRTVDLEKLRAQLAEVDDHDVARLVTAIDRRDWRQAWRLEVRAVLRLAA
jgi:hypothetical protein